MHTYIPKTICALAIFDSFTHGQEIIDIVGTMFFISRNFIQYTYQCCIYPSIATTPIAILTVRFFVGGIKVLVPPPQTFFLVVHAILAMFVTGIFIHIPHLVEIFLFSGQFSKFGKYRHSHLDGVNPPPIIYLRSVNQHIYISFDLTDSFRIGTNVI